MAPSILELFAGCGGAALGLHRAGFESFAAVEWDGTAAATLKAAGFPAVHADVRNWTASEAPALRGRVRLMWASPPCQAWSSAGKGLGYNDPRNGWPWTFDAIDAVAPVWVMCENVVGMTHHKKKAACSRGRDPKPRLCGGCYLEHVVLPNLQFRYPHVSMRILDAADYGLPQRRRRLFLVAGPKPYTWPAPTHSERALAVAKWVTGTYWKEHGVDRYGEPTRSERSALKRPADGLQRWRTIRDCLGPLILRHQSPSAGTFQRTPEEPAPTVGTKGTLYVERDRQEGSMNTAYRVVGAGTNPHGKGRGRERTFRDITDAPSPTMTAARVGNRGPWVEAAEPWRLERPSAAVFANDHKGTTFHKDGTRKASGGPERASDTLFLATGRRRLTPAESAALQGFPADYPWQGGSTAQYTQIGNAVPPHLAEVLARQIPR